MPETLRKPFMEEETLKNLMGDVEVEGEEVAIEPEAKPEPDKPEAQDEEATKVEETKEKERPYHKNPKFLRLQAERDEAIKAREEERKRHEEILERLDKYQPAPQAQQNVAVPENLKHIFGDDTEAYKALTSHLVESYRNVTREEVLAIKKQDEERARIEKDKEAKIIKEAEDALADLSERTGMDFTDSKSDSRNQLLSICEQYGIDDFNKAYELYLKLYPKDDTSEERKALAGNTSSKAVASTPAKKDEVMTHAKLKKVRFNSFFS